MRYERSKWLWIANIIMVRTGNSHKKVWGIRTKIGSVLLLVLGILRISEAIDKESK